MKPVADGSTPGAATGPAGSMARSPRPARPGGQRTLAGDVGGTKTLFGIYEGDDCVFSHRIANAEFSAPEAALGDFLDRAGGGHIDAVCLALAGPIADGGRHARLTNLPWEFDAASLERRFALPRMRLVNDFAAAAQGAVLAPPTQLCTLQRGAPLADAPRLVVGAGTGLGMAVVLPEGDGWRLVPGEGGHVAFAPADEEQVALWRHLVARHGRVTWERVVSGPGLSAIHAFVSGRDDVPAAIAAEALRDPGSDAGRALRLFLRCYGAYAGDMAMAVLARGGVYLAGGIAAKLLDTLRDSDFLAAFRAKAEHAALAAAMPVHVAVDPALGLAGAARMALAPH